MTKNCALKTIAVISFGGMLFSGVLSYRELFLGQCQLSFVRCGIATGPILGLPACVYGFLMYSLVFLVSLFGISAKKAK